MIWTDLDLLYVFNIQYFDDEETDETLEYDVYDYDDFVTSVDPTPTHVNLA